MKATRNLFLITSAILLTTGRLLADFPPIGYFSASEGNPPIPFRTGDTLHVGVHSNDTISLTGRPYFTRDVRTSAHFVRRLEDANPFFQIEPRVDIAPGFFPDRERTLVSLGALQNDSLRNNWYARHFDGHNGEYMTWMVLRNGSIFVYQYLIDGERDDSMVANIRYDWQQIITVEGDLEVEGTVMGQLLIAASGDIHLRDNILYRGANNQSGEFEQPGYDYSMTVVAGGDIIIDNTEVNRQSILLNGHFVALGGGLTFQDRNYEGDDYDGPSPDERGKVFIKGALFQAEKKELHNENHGGTGYRLMMSTDPRLGEDYFYWGIRNPWEVSVQSAERVVLDSNYYYYLGNFECDEFIALPGTKIFAHRGTIRFNRNFVIAGNEEAPVRFINNNLLEWAHSPVIVFEGEQGSDVSLSHAVFDTLFNLTFNAPNISISNSKIGGNLHIGDADFFALDSNRVTGGIDFADVDSARLNRNTLQGQVKFESINGSYIIVHNDFVSAPRTALVFEGDVGAEVIGNIFLRNDEGIYATRGASIDVHHNLFYDNRRGDGSGFVWGEGNLFFDPLLVNWRRGDYALTENSPCIDAGDPASPRDPDGTRADIGAFWLDRGMGVEDNPPYPPSIEGGSLPFEGLTASPNPFNATTVIRYDGGFGNPPYARLAIYGIDGREVADLGLGRGVLQYAPTAGTHSVVWDATAFPAGIYVVRVGSGKDVKAMKIVKVD